MLRVTFEILTPPPRCLKMLRWAMTTPPHVTFFVTLTAFPRSKQARMSHAARKPYKCTRHLHRLSDEAHEVRPRMKLHLTVHAEKKKKLTLFTPTHICTQAQDRLMQGEHIASPTSRTYVHVCTW